MQLIGLEKGTYEGKYYYRAYFIAPIKDGDGYRPIYNPNTKSFAQKLSKDVYDALLPYVSTGSQIECLYDRFGKVVSIEVK